MDKVNAFLTQTIVGAPVSLPLGQRVVRLRAMNAPMYVEPDSGRHYLTDVWRNWMVLGTGSHVEGGDVVFRPKHWKLWLSRHALWLFVSGLLLSVSTVVFWALVALYGWGWWL